MIPINEYGDEAMHFATQDNEIEILEWLATQGININARDDMDITPIHHAALNNAVNAMEWLNA